jgi:predicted aminopeptidase
MKKKLFIYSLYISVICGIAILSGCSPLYVVRASWEEANILYRREQIADVINNPSTPPEIKAKLNDVLDAREFALKLGLEPKGAYTKYSEVDRDVLVWVLSAAPKDSLTAKTWWFPIVGSIPYKGFFDKEDAQNEHDSLERKHFDSFIRPSSAFSTLGWFDDPVLSTVLKGDQVSIVDTVIHEILHSTIWIGSSAEFNESLANFVGSRGSMEFFKMKGAAYNKQYQIAESRWNDELILTQFFDETFKQLNSFYQRYNLTQNDDWSDFLSKRADIFKKITQEWKTSYAPQLRALNGKIIDSDFNNAMFIGHRTYRTELALFEELYARSGSDLKEFIKSAKELKVIYEKSKDQTPFVTLKNYLISLSEANIKKGKIIEGKISLD